MTEAGWEAMIRLNLTAQVFGAQAAARAMRDQGTAGRSSSSARSTGFMPPRRRGHLRRVQGGAEQHHADDGGGAWPVRHPGKAIAPAVIETPLTASWLATEEDRRERAAFYPLRRVGSRRTWPVPRSI